MLEKTLYLLLITFLSMNSAICSPLFWGFSIEGFPIETKALAELEKETKTAAELLQFYLQWDASAATSSTDLTNTLEAIWSYGAVPCMTWEPMHLEGKEKKAVLLIELLEGKYDAYIKNIAAVITRFGKPLIIRFGHEMNLNIYHWGSEETGYGAQSPDKYKKMVKYVAALFKKEGVKNCLWAFCPNVESIPNEPWNKPANYYPGDDFVDILGMDGYNWDIEKENWKSPWSSFQKIFEPLYLELKKISPNKPIIVFETASVDRTGGKKSGWIAEAIETCHLWGILGVIWFQATKEEDWRINQNDDYTYLQSLKKIKSSSAQSWFESWKRTLDG